MAVPNNILQTVQTYQMADLAWLLNSFAAISLSNKKFKDFNTLTANLGDTVTFDITPRFTSQAGLVVSFQPSVQRVQSLVCSQAANVSSAYTAQQFIFNVEQYMDRFGMAAMKELGTQIERDLLTSIDSTLRVNDQQNPLFGQIIPNTGPFRFFGDGLTPINSYTQLAQAIANYKNFGAADHMMRALIPDYLVPPIIGTGLNQFAMKRNDEIANSWELGKFTGSDCEWYSSNLLPIHISGTVGNAGYPDNIITLISTNDPSGQNVTQITVSEPTGSTSVNAFNVGDLIQTTDPSFNFLTFIGHVPCAQPVQFVVTAPASTVAGVATISIRTATNIGLVSAPTQNQNISRALTAGMEFSVVPSHQCGLLWSGDQWYMAMPKLPDYEPYPSSTMMDEDSGASIRHYYGNQFGQNQQGYVRDVIWGSTLLPETCMRLVFPLPSA